MEQRRNAIVELVNREGSLSFVQLKEAFPSVSEMTLRTDLKALDQARRVVRVHGGVKSVEVVVGTDDQFGRRTARNASEKQIIAEKAAALLRPNTTVFLDSGSTATAVARCVPDEPMLIFTSGLTCAIGWKSPRCPFPAVRSTGSATACAACAAFRNWRACISTCCCSA